jgi:hypothetical protein
MTGQLIPILMGVFQCPLHTASGIALVFLCCCLLELFGNLLSCSGGLLSLLEN